MTATTATEPPDARFWNRIAPKYARDPIADMPGYERSLARTQALLRPTDRVLELGCGTGTTAVRLAPGVAHLTATDVAAGMIAIAHERQAAAGVTNVMFRIAPADEPQGPPASFDAVLALNLLHLVQDRADLYRTIRTTLKPRGLFISKTACIQEMNVMIRAAIPLARAIGKAPWVAAFDARTLEAEIAAAGFTIEESARHGSKRTDPRIYIVARAP